MNGHVFTSEYGKCLMWELRFCMKNFYFDLIYLNIYRKAEVGQKRE